MSIVVYRDGCLAGDSIVIQNGFKYTAPKVFAYRRGNKFGGFGWVGNPGVAQELMRAYLVDAEPGFLEAQERMKELLPEYGATVIIMPAQKSYILCAGWHEPLMRLPSQPFAVGYDEGVRLASAALRDTRYFTAREVVLDIISHQAHATEVYAAPPVTVISKEGLNHDLLDATMSHPIEGQFIFPR